MLDIALFRDERVMQGHETCFVLEGHECSLAFPSCGHAKLCPTMGLSSMPINIRFSFADGQRTASSRNVGHSSHSL